MIQCHECRLPPTFPSARASQNSFKNWKRRQNQSFDHLPSFGSKNLVVSSNNLDFALPLGNTMPATRKDTIQRNPRASQPAVVPSVSEQWCECLDETGAIPFVDGKSSLSTEILYAQLFQTIHHSIFRILDQTQRVHQLYRLVKAHNQHLYRIPYCLD